MSRLFDKIKAAVELERVLVSWHADDQCEHRKVAAWQIVAGVADAKLIQERPSSKPNPSVVLEQILADGSTVQAVWSWLEESERAKLVTVFFLE